MTRVLVVDDDAQLRSAVARDLADAGFDVRSASNVPDAIAELREAGADILLTDLRMSDQDGIDLIDQARSISRDTRAVLMSAYATARDHQMAIELGAVRVLCKPFTSAELMQAIRQAVECETGFRGSIHGLSLVDLLQMFHYAQKSICIEIGAPVAGSVHMDQGEIVHASHEDLEGEAALRKLLAQPSGSITTKPFLAVARTVDQSFRSLLLDLLRQLDEDDQDADLDAAFDVEWSEPTGAPTSASRLKEKLPQFAPEADVVLVELTTGTATLMQGEGTIPGGLPELATALAEQITKLDPEWVLFEYQAGNVAFALLRSTRERTVVAVSDVLVGRYAIVKFRAQTGRIAALL